MNSKKYLLGIDAGTSSMKTILLDYDGNVAAVASSTYEVSYPNPGWAEMPVGRLWDALLYCLQRLGEQQSLESISGIGLSCMCPGLVSLDEQGRPLHDPILYTDRRSIREGTWIKETVGEQRLFDITANTAMAGAISGTTILWIKEHWPEIYQKTKYFGHVNTLLCAMITGSVAIDPSNASYTALYETVSEGGWSELLCNLLGVDREKLPPVRESYEVCGGVIHEELLALGIPAGTPVVIGGADTVCTAVACGTIRDGDIFESAGTTNVLTLCVDRPDFRREFINRRHALPGKWLYQGAMSNVGLSLKWCAEELCRDLKEYVTEETHIYDLMDEEAMQSNPGANGAIFLPYLIGERCPVWDPSAKGVLFGITPNVHRREIIRAVMESCCYGMRQLLDMAEETTGKQFERINLVGGGAKSVVWAQMRADITGKQINILSQKNSASVGAALLAGVGIGVFNSVADAAKRSDLSVERVLYPKGDPSEQEMYGQRYRKYLSIYRQLRELF